MRRLLPLALAGGVRPLAEALISHNLPLSQGVKAYEIFDKKRGGCIKVVMRPWGEGG
jgi:threonine dehydrogenase-like Zn-dependent dehydrogenase